MKLYDDNDPAPNPRRVKLFLREKGIEIPLVNVPLAQGAHKTPEFLAKNSLGQLPVLELDDGTYLAESVSICRYLESLYPEPPLFGRDAAESARIDMWIRRVEFRIMLPLGMLWVHVHPFTAAYAASQGRAQFKDFGESNWKVFEGACRWLDRELQGREFLAGDRYSMADIVLQSTFDFGGAIGADVPAGCANLAAWYARVSARPSAALDLSRFPVQVARKGLSR
ncbi:MAG TPA: glutathione S-transferase family protein [Myxococcota bacterium]|nr:glutathione S-transferase family protein [Myxococcota bacterium]